MPMALELQSKEQSPPNFGGVPQAKAGGERQRIDRPAVAQPPSVVFHLALQALSTSRSVIVSVCARFEFNNLWIGSISPR